MVVRLAGVLNSIHGIAGSCGGRTFLTIWDFVFKHVPAAFDLQQQCQLAYF